MGNRDINTGNLFADNLIRKQIVDDVLSWALIDYLEAKGILNRGEFWEFLNNECITWMKACTIVEQSNEDEETE